MPNFSGEIGEYYKILWRQGQRPINTSPTITVAGAGKYDGSYNYINSSTGGRLFHKFTDATYYVSLTGRMHAVDLLTIPDDEFSEDAGIGGSYTAVKINKESGEPIMGGGRRRHRRTTRKYHGRKRRSTRTRRHH